MGKYGFYWIDAVCIDMQNMPERHAQVRMMGDIYWTAEKVLVWLGEEGWDSRAAMAVMEELLPKIEDFFSHRSTTYSHSFLNPEIYDVLGIEKIPQWIWEGVADFLERNWFRRAWTLQEVLLAADVDVLCGTKNISWKKLEDFLDFLELADWHQLFAGNYKKSRNQKGLPPGHSLVSTIKLRGFIFKEDENFGIYLDNIAGGGDDMDRTLAYTNFLISQMRCRCATDPRDHFFALYGIVWRLCDMGKLSNPLISPDYTKTVAEVYTTNIKSILALSKSLALLSRVEDRSERNRTDLPSWVPDVTVGTSGDLVLLVGGAIFNASKGSLPKILRPPNLETLSLAGYWIDTIDEISSGKKLLGRHCEPYATSAALLLRMQKTYVNGQDRVEALWRTLIADTTDNLYPAPEAMREAFREEFLWGTSMFLLEAEECGDEEYQAAAQHMEALTTIARATPEGAALIPAPEEMVQRKDIHACIRKGNQKINATREAGGLVDEDETARLIVVWQNLNHERARGHAFHQVMSSVHVSRRVFRTDGGLLGLGPLSVRAGDHIFVLPGARVPFVLRPVSPAGGSEACFEMVGEAYVHGIMQGEALEQGKPEEMDLTII